MMRPEDARMAVRLGATYVGAIFAGGPRAVDSTRARAVFEAASDAGPVRRVGVFGHQTPAEIARAAEEAHLDVVQLHADPDESDVRATREATGREVWAVVRVKGSALPPEAWSLQLSADALVLDARVADRLGGTGVALDWEGLAGALSHREPGRTLVLAGGLTPDNVERAVGALAPDVVDVSSGVETAPGIKDHHRMRAFAEAVRRSSRTP